MNAKMLITGVAVAVLAAGAAASQTDPSSGAMGSSAPMGQNASPAGDTGSTDAAPHHAMHHRTHKASGERGAYAAPQQPIPYAQLDDYMKASPRQRMAMEQGSANTGSTADTAATSPSNGSMQNQSATPDGSMGSMSTPQTGGTGAMDTNPPVNGATTGAADQTPTMGMGHNGSDATGTPAAGTPNQSSGPAPH
jgi:hypothetical protein